MSAKIKHNVLLPSGRRGWRAKLQDVHQTFEGFDRYDEIYRLAERLGYGSAQEAWDANPLIEGSCNPEDFRRVPRSGKRAKL